MTQLFYEVLSFTYGRKVCRGIYLGFLFFSFTFVVSLGTLMVCDGFLGMQTQCGNRAYEKQKFTCGQLTEAFIQESIWL